MAPKPNWIAAVIFYLLFIVGILVFVVAPGLAEHSVKIALLRAALFRFICYATYDLTNLATAKDWPLTITIVDLLWGTSVTVIVGYISFLIGKWLM